MIMLSSHVTKPMTWLRYNPRVAVIVSCLVVAKAIVLFVLLPAFVNLYPGTFAADLFPDRYDLLAWNMMSGSGYRLSPDTSLTMLRSPGFVFPLAGLFFFFGKSLVAAQVMNFIASCMTAVVVFFLAKKVIRTEAGAWSAAIFCFFFPGSIVAESRGGVESLLMLGIAATIFLSYVAEERRNYRYYAFLGLAFGYTALIKPSVMLMLPLVWLYRIVRTDSLNALAVVLPRYCLAGLVAATIYVPWVIRNYQVSGEFVLTMTAGGMALDQGVYIVKNYTFSKQHAAIMREADEAEIRTAHEMGLEFRQDVDWYPMFNKTVDEYVFYKKIGNDALMQYYRSPELLVKALLVNSVAFWFQGRTHVATLMNILFTLPTLVFSCIGLVIAWRRKWNYVPIVLAITAYVVPHFFIISLARYYIPTVPLIAVLVGAFVAGLVQNSSKHSASDLKLSQAT
jgi:4-amino-4-deoxy-L-arabinose transferase-like glycosyltransferase